MPKTSWAKNKAYVYNDQLTHAYTLLYHKCTKVESIQGSMPCKNVKLIYITQTCICTDWQFTNSTDETRLSNTTDDLRHESRNTEFNFPFTVSVDS